MEMTNMRQVGHPNDGYTQDSPGGPAEQYSPGGTGGYYPQPGVGQRNPAYLADQSSPPRVGQVWYPLGVVPPSKQGAQHGTQPSNVTVVVQQPMLSSPPRSYIIFSIITCVYNPLMGALALWFSIMSIKLSNKKDYISAEKRGKEAMWFSIGGIILTLVIVFTYLIIANTEGLAGSQKYSVFY